MPSHERASRRYPCFEELEQDINAILERSFQLLMASDAEVAQYRSQFDRSSESGFYRAGMPKGRGEQPTWSPNPAYINSLEKMCEPVLKQLANYGLQLEKSLRELFFLSHEYEDSGECHRRVFHGQVVDGERRSPVTYFMMVVPHSHARFEYVGAPRVQLAPRYDE